MRPMQHISYIYIYQNAPLIRIGWISIKKKKKKTEDRAVICLSNIEICHFVLSFGK